MFRKLLGSPREILLRTFDGALGAEWRPLLDFVSPSFFDVVPLRDLLTQGREIVGGVTDRRGRADVEAAVSEALAVRDLGVTLGAGRVADADAAEDREARAQRVLELYFAQLYGADACLLDLRSAAFSGAADAPRWTPGPFFVRWEPGFLEALRALYTGYYRDDEATFDAALAELHLAGSKDLFVRHFGDPEVARFDRASFVENFHDVFVRCRDEGVRLHRNFLPLGIYLASLHDHLTQLGGGPFPVRSAFERAVGE